MHLYVTLHIHCLSCLGILTSGLQHTHSLLALNYVRRSASLGVELSGHVVDHSSSFKFERKNVWSYTSTSVNEFVEWFLIK